MPFGTTVGKPVAYLQFYYDLGRGYRDCSVDMGVNAMKDRDDDYTEDMKKPARKGHWEYAGPGYIWMPEADEDED